MNTLLRRVCRAFNRCESNFFYKPCCILFMAIAKLSTYVYVSNMWIKVQNHIRHFIIAEFSGQKLFRIVQEVSVLKFSKQR